MKTISEETARALGLSSTQRKQPAEVSGQLVIRTETPSVNVAAPTVNVAAPNVNVAAPNVRVDAPTVNVAAPNVKVEPPTVNVAAPTVNVEPVINVAPPDAAILKRLAEAITTLKPNKPPAGMTMSVTRDHRGLIESCNFNFTY
jgi:hypothetical protein